MGGIWSTRRPQRAAAFFTRLRNRFVAARLVQAPERSGRLCPAWLRRADPSSPKWLYGSRWHSPERSLPGRCFNQLHEGLHYPFGTRRFGRTTRGFEHAFVLDRLRESYLKKRFGGELHYTHRGTLEGSRFDGFSTGHGRGERPRFPLGIRRSSVSLKVPLICVAP